MAKRNRRRNTFHLKTANVGMIVLLFVAIAPWILYCLFSMNNEQVTTQIKLLERDQRTYEQSFVRETATWNRLNEPKRLEEAIARNGMSLSFPSPERSVHVAKSGAMNADPALIRMLVAARAERLEAHRETAVAALELPVRSSLPGRRIRRR
ncbi:MAG: hypothetical protein RR982_04250 [Kiritimatiellia bacterium]